MCWPHYSSTVGRPSPRYMWFLEVCSCKAPSYAMFWFLVHSILLPSHPSGCFYSSFCMNANVMTFGLTLPKYLAWSLISWGSSLGTFQLNFAKSFSFSSPKSHRLTILFYYTKRFLPFSLFLREEMKILVFSFLISPRDWKWYKRELWDRVTFINFDF